MSASESYFSLETKPFEKHIGSEGFSDAVKDAHSLQMCCKSKNTLFSKEDKNPNDFAASF